MLKCGYCGKNLVRKQWHSNSKYSKAVWYCSEPCRKGVKYCPNAKAISESVLEEAFVESYNRLCDNKQDVLEDLLAKIKTILKKEKIEEAIVGLQHEATQEMLAHTLTVIRRRMKEDGQFIIAVEPPKGDGQIRLEAIRTEDGKNWWSAFTSFEEELKGGGSVKSTFLTDINKLFELILQTDEIEGVILNPWNRTIMLDKYLIEIILGKTA